MGASQTSSPFAKFLNLGGKDKLLVLRAVAALASARTELARFSFQEVCARITADESPSNASVVEGEDAELLSRVSYAVSAAAKYVPFRSDCFPQCLAARTLLARHGLDSVIHLGVAREGAADLDAHAWLTCGDTVVTGGSNLDRYTELHRFPDG